MLSQIYRDDTARHLKGSDFQYDCTAGCYHMFLTKEALAQHVAKKHARNVGAC